jgi:hypothetical protein
MLYDIDDAAPQCIKHERKMNLFTFRSLTKPLETYENCFHK